MRAEANEHPDFGLRVEQKLRDDIETLSSQLAHLKSKYRLDNVAKLVAGPPPPSLDDLNAKPVCHESRRLVRRVSFTSLGSAWVLSVYVGGTLSIHQLRPSSSKTQSRCQ